MAKTVEEAALRAALVTSGSPWRTVEHHETIESTNARAAELARLGRSWAVVVADHQSAGRGRLARSWQAPPGTSVAVSATVPLPAANGGWVPLLTGLAVADAVEEVAGVSARLKWPNDVLLPSDGDRKVCGILCEATRSLVVVGAGVNLTQARDELPVDTATSLALVGAEVDPTTLVAAYLRALGARLAPLLDPDPDAAAAAVAEASRAYRARCATVGRRVRLHRSGPADVVGTAVDVDAEGRLVIEQEGKRTAWAAGDIVHVRPDPAPGVATELA